MRRGTNEYDEKGRLINGYDYEHQCWIVNGIIQRCGHPEEMDCNCYGKQHAGQTVLLYPVLSALDVIIKQVE